MDTTIEFCVFELVYVSKFTFNKQFLDFWTKFAQEWCFWSKNKTNENYHWILQTQISLGTKFQFKLTVLIFWTKFTQKKYF